MCASSKGGEDSKEQVENSVEGYFASFPSYLPDIGGLDPSSCWNQWDGKDPKQKRAEV